MTKDCTIDGYLQSEEWLAFQAVCYKQVDKDIAALRSSYPHSTFGIRDMVASVLASIPNDRPRFEAMYEVLKIIEDAMFWRDICNAYQDVHATSSNVPFGDDTALMCHAVAVEKIYKKHGFDKLENLLI